MNVTNKDTDWQNHAACIPLGLFAISYHAFQPRQGADEISEIFKSIRCYFKVTPIKRSVYDEIKRKLVDQSSCRPYLDKNLNYGATSLDT